MNTARFLFCLNSDDPDIVAQGLEEFRDQVLKDHDAVTSYGYHGRGSSDHVMESLRPQPVVTTVGVLASFIKSSPQLEELFILWGLPGRDDDKPLSSSHMSCMAVILHAAIANSNFCGIIVNRILHEHAKSIISQLSCGNLSLVHSTLALVLAMCRSTPQNCRDTFQKLVAISLPAFSTLLQQGKTISWEAEKQTDSTQSSKLKTDSRLLLIIIVLTAVEAADQSSGSEILSTVTALLKRITNSITKDVFFVVQLILEGLISIRKQPACEQLIGSKLVDLRFQDNLLYMYHNDDVKVQRIVHMFVLDHSSHLVNSMSKGGRGLTAGSAKASALQLLRHLEGHRDLRHREVCSPSFFNAVLFVVKKCWSFTATFYDLKACHLSGTCA
jgi:Ribosome 60S biogenesis N-terminal